MKITINDIAKKAGVSITTVSLVLNNKADSVSEKTKDKILSIAKELNYHPNQIARSLSTAKSNTIGLILPDITNPFFSLLAKGIGDALNDKGYTLLLANAYNDYKKEISHINKFQQYSVDGMILTSSNSKNYNQDFREKLAIPTVILDREIPEFNTINIIIDDVLGGYLATNYFINKGHTNIAIISADPEIYVNSSQRLEGYKKALIENKIEVDSSLIFYGNYSVNSGYLISEKLIKTKATAVFTTNDLIAFGVYKYCEENDIIIPDDISVIGFDDIPFSEFLNPKLTTIKQPIYEIGREAVESLIDLIIHPNRKPDDKIMPIELVIRNSVKRLN